MLLVDGSKYFPSKGIVCNTLETMFRWVNITPFGLPVVPLENGIVRMASESKVEDGKKDSSSMVLMRSCPTKWSTDNRSGEGSP